MVLVVKYHQNLINITKKKKECLVLCSHKKKYLLRLVHVSEE